MASVKLGPRVTGFTWDSLDCSFRDPSLIPSTWPLKVPIPSAGLMLAAVLEW